MSAHRYLLLQKFIYLHYVFSNNNFLYSFIQFFTLIRPKSKAKKQAIQAWAYGRGQKYIYLYILFYSVAY